MKIENDYISLRLFLDDVLNVFEMSPHSGAIEAVTDDEFVRNAEAAVIHVDFSFAAFFFVEQYADFEAVRVSAL